MVARWTFYDPATTDTWVMPFNPATMTSIEPTRNIAVQGTTAVDGQILLTEGAVTPQEWSFSGKTLDHAHYEALRAWVYDVPNRIQITDHFGRVLTVMLTKMEATPARAVNRYWLHEYTVTGLLLSAGAPTIGL